MRITLLALLVVSLSSCNTTKRITNLTPDSPANASVSAAALDDYRTTYGDVDLVYLSYNEVLEHDVNVAFTSTIPQWRFFQVVEKQFLVLDPASDAVQDFEIVVPPRSKLSQAFIDIERTGSTPTKYDIDDLIYQEDEDGTGHFTMTLRSVEAGDVITQRYEVAIGDLERNPPLNHDVPLQQDFPVQKLNFEYIYPNWWEVEVKRIGSDRDLPFERAEDDERRKVRLTYSSDEVPAYDPAMAQAYLRTIGPYMQIQVTNLSMGSAIRYRAPEDWTAFADEFKGYVPKGSTRWSRAFRRTAEDITAGQSSNLERLNAVLEYLYDNIEVVPERTARLLDKALEEQQGNLFQVTGLAYGMLSEAGIDSEYLMVHPAASGFFDPEFYSTLQLSQPALNVFIDGNTYLVFPGTQRSVNDSVDEVYLSQPALVLTSGGFGGFSETRIAEGLQAISSPWDDSPTMVTDVPRTTPPPPTTEPPVTDPEPINVPVETLPPPVVEPPPVQTPPVTQPEPVVEEPPPLQDRWRGSISRPQGGWTWVVSSKLTREEADEVAREYASVLFRQGVAVDVLRGASNGQVRFRIGVGQYPNREAAQAGRQQFNTVYPSDAWLLQVESDM